MWQRVAWGKNSFRMCDPGRQLSVRTWQAELWPKGQSASSAKMWGCEEWGRVKDFRQGEQPAENPRWKQVWYVQGRPRAGIEWSKWWRGHWRSEQARSCRTVGLMRVLGLFYQCREHRFNPWSGKIPHAAEQRDPCAIATEPACCNYWSLSA